MVDDGGFQPLDPFALAVLQNIDAVSDGPTQLEVAHRTSYARVDATSTRTGPTPR